MRLPSVVASSNVSSPRASVVLQKRVISPPTKQNPDQEWLIGNSSRYVIKLMIIVNIKSLSQVIWSSCFDSIELALDTPELKIESKHEEKHNHQKGISTIMESPVYTKLEDLNCLSL